jgi:hypothetical protein
MSKKKKETTKERKINVRKELFQERRNSAQMQSIASTTIV